jgi:hypothetical protein
MADLTDLVTANRTAITRLQRGNHRESARRPTSSQPRPVGVVDTGGSPKAGSVVPPRRRGKPRSEFRGPRALADYPRSL